MEIPSEILLEVFDQLRAARSLCSDSVFRKSRSPTHSVGFRKYRFGSYDFVDLSQELDTTPCGETTMEIPDCQFRSLSYQKRCSYQFSARVMLFDVLPIFSDESGCSADSIFGHESHFCSKILIETVNFQSEDGVGMLQKSRFRRQETLGCTGEYSDTFLTVGEAPFP